MRNFRIAVRTVLLLMIALVVSSNPVHATGSNLDEYNYQDNRTKWLNSLRNSVNQRRDTNRRNANQRSTNQDDNKKNKKGKNNESDSSKAKVEESTESKVALADDDVTLVVSGEGATKEDATLSALRSAIEQTYGTFVSSNTQLLNDELVKDEIVTIGSGNVRKYDVLAENEMNGKYSVTLKAIVSIGKLITYTQSKGGTADLAGASFAQKIKMENFYKKNEKKAVANMFKQVFQILPKAFDYKINVSEPEQSYEGKYKVSVNIDVYSNANIVACVDIIKNTLSGLALSDEEKKNWKSGTYSLYGYTVRNSYSYDKVKKVSTGTNTATNSTAKGKDLNMSIEEMSKWKSGNYRFFLVDNDYLMVENLFTTNELEDYLILGMTNFALTDGLHSYSFFPKMNNDEHCKFSFFGDGQVILEGRFRILNASISATQPQVQEGDPVFISLDVLRSLRNWQTPNRKMATFGIVFRYSLEELEKITGFTVNTKF